MSQVTFTDENGEEWKFFKRDFFLMRYYCFYAVKDGCSLTHLSFSNDSIERSHEPMSSVGVEAWESKEGVSPLMEIPEGWNIFRNEDGFPYLGRTR